MMSVSVCVCVSIITFVARWLALLKWCQVRSTLSTRTGKCNISQYNLFPELDHMDQSGQNHILAYDYFKRVRVSPEKSSTWHFDLICLKSTEILNNHTEII